MTGRQHNIGIIIQSTIMTGVSVYYKQPLDQTLALLLGSLCGMIMSPDWDVDGGFIGNSTIRKYTKTDWFFNTILHPYRVSYKHRSFITHAPIISTLWRILYLFIPFITILTANQNKPSLKLFANCLLAEIILIPLQSLVILCVLRYTDLSSFYLFYWLVGLTISDTLHFLLDKI